MPPAASGWACGNDSFFDTVALDVPDADALMARAVALPASTSAGWTQPGSPSRWTRP